MKTVLVTGVSKGLGVAILKEILALSDYRVIGVSRSLTDELKTVIDSYQGRFIHILFDLSKIDELESFFKKIIKEHSPLYGFVNNAAYAYDDIITNLNVEALEQMYRLNVFAPMVLAKLAIRNMILTATEGSLIHISSISAHTGYKGLAMYASTKGAVEAFSKNTAREWGEKGIRSNCICPGFMETEMSSSLSDDMKRRISQRTSLKKLTSLDSVAAMVVFLLQEKSKSITGQVYNIDAGTI